MHLLITAGNTLAPIDRVRAITNIFTGRTGAAIALAAYQRGHRVTLLTSHPERLAELKGAPASYQPDRLEQFTYRTFEELDTWLARLVPRPGIDAIVHCAAVSDYHCLGVYAPAEGTTFDPEKSRWTADDLAQLSDRQAGKVKSDEPELWLRLVRAPKLVDKMRPEWGFRGLLVKFKLEVGLSNEDLLAVAEQSRLHSEADLMVANTLEGAAHYAFIGPPYEKVSRRDLPDTLLGRIEKASLPPER